MTVKTSVRVDGLAELEDALKEIGSEVAGKNGGLVRTALMGAGLKMMRDMQGAVPVDEGDLKASIGRKRVKNPKGLSEAIEVGAKGRRGPKKDDSGRTFLHPRWLEYGTRLQPAQPFIRPAFNSNRDDAVKMFRKKLAAGIERVAKKVGAANAQKVGARIKKL